MVIVPLGRRNAPPGSYILRNRLTRSTNLYYLELQDYRIYEHDPSTGKKSCLYALPDDALIFKIRRACADKQGKE